MDSFLNDIRYAGRRILRSPAFTIAAALTLALGIGANTTIFTLVNAILLRAPVAVAEPDRLVSLYTSDYSGPPYGTSSIPDYEDFRKQTDVFAGVLIFLPRSIAVGQGDGAEGVGLEVVSDNYFSVLGVRSAHGRFFLPEEGTPGAPLVAVISDALFRRRFGGNASVIGTTVPIGGRPFTIVGVAPPGFFGAMRPMMQDVWITTHAAAAIGQLGGDMTNRGGRSAFTMARLAPGVTIEQAQARMNVVAARLHTAYPDAWTDRSNQGRRITLLPESDSRIPPQVRGPALGFVTLLMATVGILLLVCCANVASLMLARAAGRGREIGVRISLGATRRRLIQQLLVESTLVALLGGVFGILIAVWATGAMLSLLPPLPIRIGLDLSIDSRVLTFTALASLATGIAFGLAPALRVTRPDIVSVLKSESGSMELGGRRLTLHNVLVVSQVTMSVILLVGAALFVRALANAASIDPGFRVENLLVVEASPRPGIQDADDPGPLMEQAQERLSGLPGVTAATWAGALPLSMEASRRSVAVAGYTPGEGEDMEFHFFHVGPRYFGTMEIPLAKGRDFERSDRRGAPAVVIVNEAFAQRFWPGADALGKRISVRGADGPYAEVVGIARSGRLLSLAEASPPMMFFPALQEPTGTDVIIRTSGDPMAMLPAIQREIETLAPTWTLFNTRTMEQHIATSVLPQRIAGGVLAVFGFVATVLVSVGVYGVVAYSVATRTREIGVRIALGARPRDARWFVVRQGARLVAIGVALALPIAWASMRLLSGFLMGASASDPMAFIFAVAILALVALVATYVPARRASLIDPMVALRTE